MPDRVVRLNEHREYHPAARAVNVSSGIHLVSQGATAQLQASGVEVRPEAQTSLVLDVPRGYALHVLSEPDQKACRRIVVTWNPCPEHAEDLWDLGPGALIEGGYFDSDPARVIGAALAAIEKGERYRLTPWQASRLTRAERRAHHLAIHRLSHKEIARHAGLKIASVGNVLSTVYDKLHIHNHQHALLRYYGIPHAVQGDPESAPAPTPIRR